MSAIVPDPEDIGKLFVGGLSSSTTKEILQGYFSQYGEVVDSVVMKNKETGRSRGFGFVTFKDPNCIFNALQIKNHELDGKKIDPKECTPRSMQKTRKQGGKCKVFLGGLPPDITEEAIRNGMSKFGKVDQVVIMHDQETKKCRGFGFLSFELEESIDQACAERYVNINGKQIECKKAEPRLNPKNLIRNQNGIDNQAAYASVPNVQPNSWNVAANQSLFNMQGNPYASYASYTHPSMMPYNGTAPWNPNIQPLTYAQPYPANYGTSVGNFSYPQVPANPFPQPPFTVNATTSDMSAPAAAYNAESVKSADSNDYSQNASLYGKTRSTYGANASSVSYNSQSVVPSASHQRFHPYKV